MVIRIFKKRYLLFFVLAIVLSSMVLGLFFFNVGGLFSKYDSSTYTSSSEDVPQSDTSQESTFSGLLDKNKVYQDGVPSILNEPMRLALEFLTVNKETDSEGIVLSEGYILVKCVSSKPEMSFEVMGSNDDTFEYVVGDMISFVPNIESNSLVVQSYDGGLYLATEMSSSDIKENLDPGDMLVYMCKNPNCVDGILSWALIFKHY